MSSTDDGWQPLPPDTALPDARLNEAFDKLGLPVVRSDALIPVPMIAAAHQLDDDRSPSDESLLRYALQYVSGGDCGRVVEDFLYSLIRRSDGVRERHFLALRLLAWHLARGYQWKLRKKILEDIEAFSVDFDPRLERHVHKQLDVLRNWIDDAMVRRNFDGPEAPLPPLEPAPLLDLFEKLLNIPPQSVLFAAPVVESLVRLCQRWANASYPPESFSEGILNAMLSDISTLQRDKLNWEIRQLLIALDKPLFTAAILAAARSCMARPDLTQRLREAAVRRARVIALAAADGRA